MTKETLIKGSDLLLLIENTEHTLECLEEYKAGVSQATWTLGPVKFQPDRDFNVIIYKHLKEDYENKLKEYKEEFDKLCDCPICDADAGA